MEVGELRELIERGNAADRAFADGVIRMKRGPLQALHPLLEQTASAVHAETRLQIQRGILRGARLRHEIEAADDRDHFVEELLGIAYPPLDEATPGPEQIPYVPSGYDEIVHAFEASSLGAGDGFLDLGSGLGKAVMLAELLCGAIAHGVEVDGVLHTEAARAARGLGIASTFTHGDARTAPYPRTDVVFMYLPFTGTVLETVLGRIMTLAPRVLCAGSVAPGRYPIRQIGEGQSWLRIYSVGGNSSVTDVSSDAPST